MRRVALRWVLASAALWLPAPAQAATAQGMTLRPTTGGVLLQGRLTVTKPDELVGLWSSVGRARLLRCAPTCQVATSLPLQGTVILGQSSMYRVVIGGEVRTGQRVPLFLRLRSGQVVNAVATVVR